MPASPTAPGRATGGCAGCGGRFSSRLSRVLAQSETDAERLKAIGCLPERVSVAGNLKFDVRAAEEAEATRQLRAWRAACGWWWPAARWRAKRPRCWRPGRACSKPIRKLAMVLAPRHPERFAAVAALLDRSGIPWVRRMDWDSQPASALKTLQPGEIVLLDTIGELASIYSLAAVAFVGGSLVPAGGHNPLEPAQFGVAIVMGPHYANFRAITDDLLTHQALRIAKKEELAEVLIEQLRDRTAASAMGERARQVFVQQAGATARCFDALRELLSSGSTEERRL